MVLSIYGNNGASTGAGAGAYNSGMVLPLARIGGLSRRSGLPVKNGDEQNNPAKGRYDKNECQSCNNRKYQDGSDDSGVSFQSPTKINPQSVASAVRGHEREHVFREQSKARGEGKKVVSQSVTMHNGICPECGKTYVSGGTTRTVTKGQEQARRFQVGQQNEGAAGAQLDRVV